MSREVTFAETRGHEVYVYVRGRLVMKRWLRGGWYSGLFHDSPCAVSYLPERLPTPEAPR